MLHGRRRVWIFHRDDTPLLYPRYELGYDPTFQVAPEMNEVEPQSLLKIPSSERDISKRVRQNCCRLPSFPLFVVLMWRDACDVAVGEITFFLDS